MKREWIENMKARKRLRLSVKDWLVHYNIALIVLLVPLLPIFSLIKYYITNTYDGVRTHEDMILATSIFYIPFVILFFYQRSKLRLREFNATFSETQFNQALKKTVTEQKWHFEIKENEFYRLFTDKDFEGEYGGYMITIIRVHNKILINSIDEIGIDSSFFQFKQNKENINNFIENLDKMIQTKQ